MLNLIGVLFYTTLFSTLGNSARPPASIFCGINSVNPGHDLVSRRVESEFQYFLRPGIQPTKPIVESDITAPMNLETLKGKFSSMPKREPICWRTSWPGFEIPPKYEVERVKAAARFSDIDLVLK